MSICLCSIHFPSIHVSLVFLTYNLNLNLVGKPYHKVYNLNNKGYNLHNKAYLKEFASVIRLEEAGARGTAKRVLTCKISAGHFSSP